HEHALKSVDVLAKIARVSCVDRITFSAFHSRGDVFATDGGFDDVVDVADFKAVARGRFAVHIEVEEIAADRALGERTPRVGHISQLALDLHRELLNFAQIRPENFYAEHAAETGGEHFSARLDWHPENVRHAGRFDVGVDFS